MSKVRVKRPSPRCSCPCCCKWRAYLERLIELQKSVCAPPNEQVVNLELLLLDDDHGEEI